MPYVIAVLIALAVSFGVGRASVDEPPKPGYKVIEVEREVTKTKRVPADMPDSCRQAAALLPRLQADLEGVDVLIGRLAIITDEVATFADQPNGQREINDRLQQASDLQGKIAGPSMAALATAEEYRKQSEICSDDLE